LAILIRADHPWLTTNQFLDKLDSNLAKAMKQDAQWRKEWRRCGSAFSMITKALP
jgi:hypothetical protein